MEKRYSKDVFIKFMLDHESEIGQMTHRKRVFNLYKFLEETPTSKESLQVENEKIRLQRVSIGGVDYIHRYDESKINLIELRGMEDVLNGDLVSKERIQIVCDKVRAMKLPEINDEYELFEKAINLIEVGLIKGDKYNTINVESKPKQETIYVSDCSNETLIMNTPVKYELK